MSRALRAIVGVAAIALAFTPFGAPFASYLIPLGASLVIGAVLQRNPQSVQRLQQQSVMVRSAVKPQEVLYGTDKKSGVVPWYGTSGDENEFLWFVVAVVEHEISGYKSLWLDATEIDISTEIDGSGFVTHADFVDADNNKLVKTGFYTGEDGQTADSELVAAFTEWTTDHKGEGVAYFWVRCELDKSDGGTDAENPEANIWSNGYPRDISCTLDGALVYDPRLDDINGGSGDHRVDTASTWEWADNPILCRTDYLRSTRFGPAYTSSEIDWPTVITDADICEESVSLPDSGSQPRYTMNGVLSVADTPKNNLEALQTADYGTTLFLPAGIECRAGSWDASSHTIDDTWLLGTFSAVSSVSTDSAYNAVRGQYLSKDDDYTLVEFDPRLSSAYETEDGVGRIFEDIVLPFTDDEFTAQRLAITALKKSRQQTTVKLQCNFRAEVVELYQVVTLDLPGYQGLNDSPEVPDTFRVIGKASSTDGTISLDLIEEVETDWNYEISDLATPPIIPSVSRDPSGVLAPSNLAATTVVNGILLSWDLPALAGISHIEVYSSASDARGSAALLSKTLSESFFHAQGDGVVNYYWILARGHNGLTSIWEPDSSEGVEGIAGISANVPDFTPGFVGGTSDFVYTLNMDRLGNPDDGEIRLAGLTFEHPDGTTITKTNATSDIRTVYESSTTGRFFIMYSEVVAQTRFGGTAPNWGAGGGNSTSFVCVTHDDTNGWRARNNAGTYFAFPETGSPISTDCIIAICEKTATSGGINTIQVLTGGLAGVDGVDGADGADGSVGIDARAVNLLIDDQTFEYDTNDANPSPSSGVATATALNAEGTVWYEFFLNDSSEQNTTSNTYAYTPPASYTDMPEKIEVQIREDGDGTGSPEEPILARDQITISGLKAGSDAITIIVSNEAHTLPTTNTGDVTYTGSGTDFEVWQGTTQVPYDGSGPYASPSFRISVTASPNITPGSASTPSTYVRRYGDHDVMTADNASITYSIIVKNSAGVENTFTKKQTFAKSTEGDDGSDGAPGDDGADGDDGLNNLDVRVSRETVTVTAAADGTVSAGQLATTEIEFHIWDGDVELDLTITQGNISTTPDSAIDKYYIETSQRTGEPANFTMPNLSWPGSAPQHTIQGALTAWGTAVDDTVVITYPFEIRRYADSSGSVVITKEITYTRIRAGAGGSSLVALEGAYVSSSSVTTTNPVSTYLINSSGTEQSDTHDTSPDTIGTWLSSGNATDYDVRAMPTTEQEPTSGSGVGTWLDCVSNRSWSVTDTDADTFTRVVAGLTIQLRLAGGEVLISAPVTLRAWKKDTV